MSAEVTTGKGYHPGLDDWWEPPEPPTDLIFDDGVPLETNRHRIAMNVLIDSALYSLPGNSNSFGGGNMFVYYSREQAMNRDFRGPDFFVVLDVAGDRERQGWIVWEESGRYPNLIIELMLPSTAKADLGEKKQLYERTFRTAEYYVYDPFDAASLQGWHFNGAQGYTASAERSRLAVERNPRAVAGNLAGSAAARATDCNLRLASPLR